MITAYQSIFIGIPYVIFLMVIIGLLDFFFSRERILVRSMIFAPTAWIIAPFYIFYMLHVQSMFPKLIIAGFLELCFFVVYLLLFKKLYLTVSQVGYSSLEAMLSRLKWGTLLLVCINAPIHIQDGVGIFADGSRIDFIVGSRVNLYLVYASILLQIVMVPIIASIINLQKRWSKPVLLYLVLMSLFSILAGSRGLPVLALMSIVGLLKFEHMKEYIRLLRIPICASLLLVILIIYFVGSFLSLNPSEMFSLMFTRFFITNDARALAIDWSHYLANLEASLFREAFRSFLAPPQYPPLGQLLYSLQFGTTGLIGANASATALFIAYGTEIEKLFFVILLLWLLIMIYLSSVNIKYNNILVLTIGVSFVRRLTQDFLAFQVFMNLLILLAVLFCLFRFIRQAVGVPSAGPIIDDLQRAKI